MITSVFGNEVREDNHFARYFTRNKEAVDAFFKRKSEYGGLNLSQRVWKYTGDLKTEMEMALSVSIGEGQSASTISRRVRKYLQNPDLMFRRFRVKTGEEDILDADGNVTGKRSVFGRVWKRKVVDAKTGDVSWQTVNLKDYSFGRGVYRSSYKNAMRLARTETNMAYRSAEQDRWQRMDFILGYRVVMSDNHPEHDICDYLSAKRGETGNKGTYPKDFVFKGWHPQCRCYVVPIIADDDEFDRMQETIAEGREPAESENMIHEPNGEFRQWWADNKQRVASAQSLPYWVKDNKRALGLPEQSQLQRISSKLLTDGHTVVELTTAEKNRIESTIKELARKTKTFPEDLAIGYTQNISDGGTLMSWRGNQLNISCVEYKMVNGDKFCPARELLSAISKRYTKQPLTFNEEYAIESLYHEGVHAHYPKQMEWMRKDYLRSIIMEASTQLYARNYYPKFLKALKLTQRHFDSIQTNGYGYNDLCKILRPYVVNKDTFLVNQINGIVTGDVDPIKGLNRIFAKAGISERNRRNIYLTLNQTFQQS